jgi:cystathionine beta-lyase
MVAVEEDSLAELRRRTSAKWRTYPPDVLPLPVAEMDFPVAAPVAEALHAAIRRSDLGYANPNSGLAEALANFAARRWGWQVDPAQVALAPEVGVAVVQVLRLLVRPGDRVVINPPVYDSFFPMGGRGRLDRTPVVGPLDLATTPLQGHDAPGVAAAVGRLPGGLLTACLLRWSFWRSFHQALLQPTRPHWAESRPNLSCLDPTGA